MSSAIAGGIELSRSGRLSVIVATWSAMSSLIVSKVEVLYLYVHVKM
jgi:hypothetical protein